ncbi:MAG: pilus assembly protein [Chloroflexi bacterium]|nr:pilus assembly protein [Chloroflexota bacterium]
MRLNHRRLRRSHQGQALVEFALVSVMMMIIIMGTVDLGRAMRVQIALSNAAREGARANTDRQCTTNTHVNSPQQRAIAGAPELSLTTSNVTVTYQNSAGTTIGSLVTVPGDRTVVTVSQTFTSVLPFISDIISGTGLSANMKSTVTMAVGAINATCT